MKRTILIVDNDKNFTEMLSEVLIGYGYQTIRCNSYNDIISFLINNPIDLILLDIILYEFYGTEIIKVLDANRTFSQIPIIFLTALDREQVEIDGDHSWLSKPFKLDELIKLIDRKMLALS